MGPVRADRKSISEIKDLYETVYKAPLHLKRLGSLEECYDMAKKAFAKDPNNALAWVPR